MLSEDRQGRLGFSGGRGCFLVLVSFGLESIWVFLIKVVGIPFYPSPLAGCSYQPKQMEVDWPRPACFCLRDYCMI